MVARLRRENDFVRAVISFSKFAASGKVQAKKNLGLMQMQYKNVYVAYMSMGANPARTEASFFSTSHPARQALRRHSVTIFGIIVANRRLENG